MQGVSVTVTHSLQPEDITYLVVFSDAKALFTVPRPLVVFIPLSGGGGTIENQASKIIFLPKYLVISKLFVLLRRKTCKSKFY